MIPFPEPNKHQNPRVKINFMDEDKRFLEKSVFGFDFEKFALAVDEIIKDFDLVETIEVDYSIVVEAGPFTFAIKDLNVKAHEEGCSISLKRYESELEQKIALLFEQYAPSVLIPLTEDISIRTRTYRGEATILIENFQKAVDQELSEEASVSGYAATRLTVNNGLSKKALNLFNHLGAEIVVFNLSDRTKLRELDSSSQPRALKPETLKSLIKQIGLNTIVTVLTFEEVVLSNLTILPSNLPVKQVAYGEFESKKLGRVLTEGLEQVVSPIIAKMIRVKNDDLDALFVIHYNRDKLPQKLDELIY